MFIIDYLKSLLDLCLNENIPILARFALAIFILCLLSFLSFINIMIYFLVIININNEKFKNFINKYPLLGKIVNVYKKTRIYFLIYEIVFFISVNFIILSNCYKLFSNFIP